MMRGGVFKEGNGRWRGVEICEWSFLPNGAAFLSLFLSNIDVYLTLVQHFDLGFPVVPFLGHPAPW